MCDLPNHSGSECPYMYMRCKKGGCDGISMIMTSKTERNPNRKFLRCSKGGCSDWKWLDEFIMCSYSETKNNVGCYNCGIEGHMKVECPWRNYPCYNKGCSGTMALKTSNKGQTQGWKYLKCYACGGFKWLNDMIRNKKKYDVSININLSLDDFCNQFASNANVM